MSESEYKLLWKVAPNEEIPTHMIIQQSDKYGIVLRIKTPKTGILLDYLLSFLVSYDLENFEMYLREDADMNKMDILLSNMKLFDACVKIIDWPKIKPNITDTDKYKAMAQTIGGAYKLSFGDYNHIPRMSLDHFQFLWDYLRI